MKLKIKVKRINKNLPLPRIIEKGDWIDLYSSETKEFNAPHAFSLKEKVRKVEFDIKLIKLGVAIELPKGFEASLTGRSSLTRRFGVMKACSGVIDNSYCGNNDEWLFNAMAVSDAIIHEGDRICQFRIQLSQKATFWQKLKWLFTSGIKIIEVDSLDNTDRDGFGSTGTK